MNSLEVYDFTERSNTAPTTNAATEASTQASSSASSSVNSSATAQPSLEEEVQQVFGSLSRFWGGVRKQGQTAIETARRDLGGVVQQAQREIGRLSAPAAAASTSDNTIPTVTTPEASSSSGAGAEAASSASEPSDDSSSSVSASSSTTVAAPSSFFSRLQSSLPPNLQETLRTLEASVSASEVQLQHRAEEIRQQLEAQLHRVQEGVAPTLQRVQQEIQTGVARAQAEAGPRAEALFKDASVFLADAVKVVPPSDTQHGVSWDGSDVWTDRPQDDEISSDSATNTKGKAPAGLSRTEAMLRRVRTDGTLYTVELSADEAKEAEKVAKHDAPEEIDADLEALRTQLVPGHLSEDAFWARYHFRVHQVEVDDERRRALLAAQTSQQDEEIFSWDDEDDAPAATSVPPKSPAPTLKPNDPAAPEGSGSEASYDVVSGAASPTPPKQTLKEEKEKKDDDADSDWE